MSDIISVLPKEYGFVVLSVFVSGLVVFSLAGPVMAARKKCGVEYPNMYATVIDVDGKKYTNAKSVALAEEFNNHQRAHQNALETHYSVVAFTIVTGLYQPIVASVSLIFWTIGAYFYGVNYRSKGSESRNSGLAAIRMAGGLGLVGNTIIMAYALLHFV